MKEGPDMTRRKLLVGGAALVAAQSIRPIEAFGAKAESAPALAKEIVQLQKDLVPGGRYDKIMHTPKLITDTFLTELRGRMTRVNEEMRNIHIGRTPNVDPSVTTYIYHKEVPGLVSASIDTGKVMVRDGKTIALKQMSNAFFVRSKGALFKVIPYHCIEGTPEESRYSRLPEHDVSARLAEDGEYHGSSLEIDEAITSESTQGMFGVTVGEKDGTKDAFYGHLVRMTPAFYQRLFRGVRMPNHNIVETIQNGFWKIIPAEQGSIERWDANWNPIERGRGRSGSLEVAYDPKRKTYNVVGSCLGVWKVPDGPLEGLSIGFYSGPDALHSVIEAERSGNPPKPVEKTPKIAARGR